MSLAFHQPCTVLVFRLQQDHLTDDRISKYPVYTMLYLGEQYNYFI